MLVFLGGGGGDNWERGLEGHTEICQHLLNSFRVLVINEIDKI